jgi:hypothetical protein
VCAGKEGPIHDVQWSPTGKDFVVVHGCILDPDRDTKDHVVALTSILGLLLAYFRPCFFGGSNGINSKARFPAVYY